MSNNNSNTLANLANLANVNNTNSDATVGAVTAVAVSAAPAAQIDTLFSLEHQGMIAAKYRTKYSDADQAQHKTLYPQFAGNHFLMYVMAETLAEARKAVFSANKPLLLNQLQSAMMNYTATTPGATLTELQVQFNKTTDLQLQALYEQVSEESLRGDLLKVFAQKLKQQSRTGKDTDAARAKFYHASAVLGITPQSIW